MRRVRIHRSTLLVLLIGALVAVVAFGTTRRVIHSDEQEILAREARLTALTMQSLIESTASSLESATAVATATESDHGAFEEFADSPGLEFYTAVLLIHDRDGRWQPDVEVGELSTPFDGVLSDRIAALDTGTFSLVGYRGEGIRRTLGLAYRSSSAPDTAVYAEFPMPAGIGIGNGDAFVESGDDDGDAFVLDFALYIGSERDDNIAFSSRSELPFTGPRAVLVMDLDDQQTTGEVLLDTEPGTVAAKPNQLVIVTAPRAPLISGLARSLPWLLVLAALAGALPIAALMELISRRRDRALEVVEELEEAERRIVAEQERFHDIIAGAPDAMVNVNTETDELTFLNRSELLGYSSEELRGEGGLRRLVHPDDVERVQGLGAELGASGDGGVELEVRMRSKDGDEEWVRLRVKALARDEEGQATQVLATCTVITAEHAAEAERRGLEHQLRQSQRMEAVGQLAGGIAHDFNNLLAVILSYASFAVDELENHPARKDIEEVIGAARRAADLTSQLLTFSRRQIVEPSVLDLNDIVAEMDRMLRRTVGENIEFTTHLAEELPPIHADSGEVEQVLMNLAVNARDAIGGNDGTLILETRAVELDSEYADSVPDASPGTHVVMSVSDTGGGMDPDVVGRAFEPFFTTKEPGKGTGMGLATVYGIVRRWGGHVTLYSEPGHGTTVRVYFPAVAGKPCTAPVAPTAGSVRTGTETILVVEDERGVRNAARRILERAGYEVLEACSGAEALEHAEAHRADVLLTDVVMPGGVSGRDLAEQLSAIDPQLRVVFMSGYNRDVVAHQGVLEEGVHLVEKPFTADGLLSAIGEALTDVVVGPQP